MWEVTYYKAQDGSFVIILSLTASAYFSSLLKSELIFLLDKILISGIPIRKHRQPTTEEAGVVKQSCNFYTSLHMVSWIDVDVIGLFQHWGKQQIEALIGILPG